MRKDEGYTYQVGVSGVQDGQKTDSEQLTSGRTELDVTTLVVVDGGLGPIERSEMMSFLVERNS